MGEATFDYSGQVVLITGGTKGLGRGIAARFDAAGAHVIVCARSEGDRPLPSRWSFLPADLRDGTQAWAMVDAAVAVHGRLDVVINNAGGAPPADTATASPRFTEKIVALNLLAPIFVSQRANHYMQGRPTGGCIINIGSVVSHRPSPTVAAYGAAKAGLNNFSMTTAQEWAPKVRVNTVIVGMVITEKSALHYGDEATIARVAQTIPIGRMAVADDVANACLYLASSGADYITGAELVVHGGGDRPAFLAAHDQA